jgi:hypothetical protein
MHVVVRHTCVTIETILLSHAVEEAHDQKAVETYLVNDGGGEFKYDVFEILYELL